MTGHVADMKRAAVADSIGGDVAAFGQDPLSFKPVLDFASRLPWQKYEGSSKLSGALSVCADCPS